MISPSLGLHLSKFLKNLYQVLQRLVLNWKKCYFMVNKKIVLGHVIFKKGIEIDKIKI